MSRMADSEEWICHCLSASTRDFCRSVMTRPQVFMPRSCFGCSEAERVGLVGAVRMGSRCAATALVSVNQIQASNWRDNSAWK